MCNNECVSKGKCEHNEECHDNVCFTSEQSKVVEKLIAKAKEDERTKTIDEIIQNLTDYLFNECDVHYDNGTDSDNKEAMYKCWDIDKWIERMQPSPFNKGELVEVSNDGSHWKLVRFSHKENGKYMCIEDDDDLPMISEWKYCQKYGTLGKDEEVNHV